MHHQLRGDHRDNVTVIKFDIVISLLLTIALGSAFPTASIMLCGGLIIALKFLIPYIPD